MSQEKVSLLEALMFSAFAGVGGILSYVLRELNEEKAPNMKRAAVEGLSSGFVGLIAMFICKALELDWHWSGVIVGCFGWLGASASIALISNTVKSKLGIGQHNDRQDP